MNTSDLIKKWKDNNAFGNEMPDDAKQSFTLLYKLSQKTLTHYVLQADEFRQQEEKAKTGHKKDLYKRKFNKIKKKFQDELHRLNQIVSIMNDYDIPIPKIDSIVNDTNPEAVEHQVNTNNTNTDTEILE